jgi:hypothetical protein
LNRNCGRKRFRATRRSRARPWWAASRGRPEGERTPTSGGSEAGVAGSAPGSRQSRTLTCRGRVCFRLSRFP